MCGSTRCCRKCWGCPKDQFIWLRNAGNIITGPLSSTMRSLALACAIKGGKEIAIIGHTDCQVGKTTTMELIDRFRALGVERQLLPANVNEFFGMFASERANVIKAVDIVRQSPLIGPKIPVHGLLVDIETGKVEWLVNGYQTLDTMGTRWKETLASADQTVDALKSLTDFEIGGIKFPETKIGEAVTKAEDWLSGKIQQLEGKPAPGSPPRNPQFRRGFRYRPQRDQNFGFKRAANDRSAPEAPPRLFLLRVHQWRRVAADPAGWIAARTALREEGGQPLHGQQSHGVADRPDVTRRN